MEAVDPLVAEIPTPRRKDGRAKNGGPRPGAGRPTTAEGMVSGAIRQELRAQISEAMKRELAQMAPEGSFATMRAALIPLREVAVQRLQKIIETSQNESLVMEAVELLCDRLDGPVPEVKQVLQHQHHTGDGSSVAAPGQMPELPQRRQLVVFRTAPTVVQDVITKPVDASST